MINKIYVILPVYNEGKSIYLLLKKYESFFKNWCNTSHEIVIINDCSNDDTDSWIIKVKEESKSLNLNYITHKENLGLEGALFTGFNHIKDNLESDAAVVTMDSDDTHNPFLIREMIHKINEGADIVIASRYCKQSRVYGLSKTRRFLSRGARYLYTLMWRIKGVKDYTCGFRAYKSELLKTSLDHYKENFIQEKGFTVTAEILKKMNLFKPVIVEIPMILKYSNKWNASNMNILKTIQLTLKMLFKKDF